MTTKKQEREALEQIKKILSALGPGYLATAFEGCLEDAENNIDDDAAYSMKSRWESAEQKLEAMRAELAEAKEQATAARMEADRCNKKNLSYEDLGTASAVLQHYHKIKYEADIEEQNNTILKYAETPDCDEFRTAVAKRKLSTRLSGQLEELIARIETARYAE